MADFEKVRTGHARWPAQWPAVRLRELAYKRWPVVRRRNGPIACGPGDMARSLRCGTVSDAFVLLSPV